MARARIQEGDVDAAIPLLEQALKLSTRAREGALLPRHGAEDAGPLRRGARAPARSPPTQYPRDRVVLNQIGRVQFLQRQFDEAIADVQAGAGGRSRGSAGALQPDARLPGAGDAENAERERALYTRFKADETAQAITGPYRLKSPDDNNERQPIHEHGTAIDGIAESGIQECVNGASGICWRAAAVSARRLARRAR